MFDAGPNRTYRQIYFDNHAENFGKIRAVF